MSVDVVLATHNQGKVEEFRALLDGAVPGIGVRAYDGPEPVEDGVSFVENALIKARAAAAHTGLVALADDSGIGVDVLGGSPGIFSARWAGHGRGAEANIDLLLDQLADLHDPARTGRFTCVIALVVPDPLIPGGLERVVEGVWPGRIARERRGSHGHGYDPVFVPEGGDVTAAELTREEKNRVSHRGRAFEALRPALAEVVDLLDTERSTPAS